MLLAFLDLSPTTLLILGVLSILLFGERLPEVARAVGKGLMEFKKGMSGIEEEIRNVVNSATTSMTESLPRTDDLLSYEDHSTTSDSEPLSSEPTSSEPAYADATPTEPAYGETMESAFTEATSTEPLSAEATPATAALVEATAIDLSLADSTPVAPPSADPASAATVPAEPNREVVANS
jgi:sec-independent protein translocase protein TatA